MADAKAFDLALDDKTAALLCSYAHKLCETNEHLNLTAITQPREVEVKHLLDSLLCAALPEVTGAVADVGTGGGFPGVVVAAHRQDADVTLIDATGKKLRFIETACGELGIAVKTVHGRAEELARSALRECFDAVTARAVAALPALCELCLPLVKPGGVFVAMKGAEWETELAAAENAIRVLGGSVLRTETFTLPEDGGTRALIVIKKISHTPTKYPRGGKNIAKNPLT